MAVSIDGPVGLRWRKQKVKSNTDDQAKIIGLLAGISRSQGGKKEEWPTTPLSGSNGSCPQFLADAIWDFQLFWKNSGVFHNIDGVVDPGMNTLRQLNLLASGSPAPVVPDTEIVNKAFSASRIALMTASTRLYQLLSQANALAKMDGIQRLSALTKLQLGFAREIAVISRRLLVPADPGSPQFRDALAEAVRLIEQNLTLPNTITPTRNAGMCSNPKRAFAWTSIGRRPPNTELCTLWFDRKDTDADNLRRDVVTHEYFHSVGLHDVENIRSTAEALRNANTLAQVVALVADRWRQKNSDGGELAVPPLPSP
jgi:hypothetical protein